MRPKRSVARPPLESPNAVGRAAHGLRERQRFRRQSPLQAQQDSSNTCPVTAKSYSDKPMETGRKAERLIFRPSNFPHASRVPFRAGPASQDRVKFGKCITRDRLATRDRAKHTPCCMPDTTKRLERLGRAASHMPLPKVRN